MLRTIVIAAALLSASPALAALPADTYYHPARLVTLPDGRRMNLFCLGQGAPTVVLDAGFGSGASTWAAGRMRAAIPGPGARYRRGTSPPRRR